MKLSYGAVVQDARGRFGGTVHSAWRGVRLLRRFRAPSNPKTALQVEVRRIFINCGRAWLAQQTITRAAWTTYAVGKNFTGRNKFIALQVPALKGDPALADFVGTPGDASTIAPASVTVTPGAGTLTCVVPTPTAPAGWTCTSAVVMAIQSSDWGSAGVSVAQAEGEDVTAPYSIALTGLPTVLFQVRAFYKWLAPDLSVRYSASASGSGTPT